MTTDSDSNDLGPFPELARPSNLFSPPLTSSTHREALVDDLNCVRNLSRDDQGHPHVRMAFIWQIVFRHCLRNVRLAVDIWLKIIEGSEKDYDLWLWEDGDEKWMDDNLWCSLSTPTGLEDFVYLYPAPLQITTSELTEEHWEAARCALQRRLRRENKHLPCIEGPASVRVLALAWFILVSAPLTEARRQLGFVVQDIGDMLQIWFSCAHNPVKHESSFVFQIPDQRSDIYPAVKTSSAKLRGPGLGLVFLDHEMAQLGTTLATPWSQNPSSWLEFNREHIVTSVGKFLLLSENERLDLERYVRHNGLYSRAVVYAYVHLKFCGGDARTLNILRETLDIWKAWDIVTSLSRQRSMKNCLRELLEMNKSEFISNDHLCSGGDSFHKLLSLDSIGCFAHLAVVFKDKSKIQQFLVRRGEEAQSLLDILQASSGLYPECLVLKGLQIVGRGPMASGTFGEVWRGLIRGQAIAVKILKIYASSDLDKLLKAWSCETVIWKQLFHSNVLPFYGIYHLNDDRSRVCLISPWMESGHIVQFLELVPNADRSALVLDIATGLEYLHCMKPSIIHGDLKGVNILITPKGRACLADFGVATANDSQLLRLGSASGDSKQLAGMVRWWAPELLSIQSNDVEHGENSLASDIYAFACVCYEIYAGNVPFHEIKFDPGVILAVMQGRRPCRPPDDLCNARGLDDEMWGFIQGCWTTEPKGRPTATQIVERLRLRLHVTTDEDVPCEWSMSFPSLLSHSLYGHSFSLLSQSKEVPGPDSEPSSPGMEELTPPMKRLLAGHEDPAEESKRRRLR